MKVSNPENWHESLVKACSVDTYVPGREGSISVTALLQPPQLRYLWLKHQHEIKVPVERIFDRAIGRAFHLLMEQAGVGIKEERYYATIDGQEISAQIDLLNQHELTDYKFCSVFAYIFGQSGWEHQLQIQRWICTQNGIDVDLIQNVLCFKDWSRHKVNEDGYPTSKSVTVRYQIWDDERVEALIRHRLKLHAEGATATCTDEDRWARGEAWAVKKPANKKATKVFKLEEGYDISDAMDYVKERKGYHVEHRPPEYVRCEHHCDVAEFCNQWKGERGE